MVFWAKDAGTPSQRFDLAKQSTPELIAFMRRMPKGADLHNHVSGASYSELILARAENIKENNKGLNYDVYANAFTDMPPNKKNIISIQELKNNPAFLAQFLNAASMRGWFPNTTNGHDHFFAAFGCFSSGKGKPEEIIPEIWARSRYENLQYLELMVQCVPDDVSKKADDKLKDFDMDKLEEMFEKIAPLTKDQAIEESIRQYLNEREKKILEETDLDYAITGNDGDLVIRYIVQVKRNGTPKDFFKEAVLSIWAVNIDNRIVGLNVVAPEDDPASQKNFDDQMKILDFLWNKMGKPKFTLHAGELAIRESPVEAMKNRIRDTIEKGHALRIGHGVSIGWEMNVAGLLKKMREQGILVEICLSSNEGILDVKDKDHPFLFYRRAGVPVSINTDDEGVNRSNLTMEFVKAIQRYDLNYDDVKELIRNSLEYSFLPGNSLFENRDYNRIIPEFKEVRSQEWKAGPTAEALRKANPKMNRQVILERALVEFEKSLLNGFEEQYEAPF
ncbi:MAG: adenosine deaminase [Acidobacteriota bacterium]|nr:adenosine deaminase [Acidobacteriota bacterium]